MATINFLYRSKKDKAPLTLRLLFRINGIDHTIDCRTGIIIERDYWVKLHNTNSRDQQLKSKQAKLNSKLQNLSDFILSAFNLEDLSGLNKKWLNYQIELHENPAQDKSKRSNLLIDNTQFIIDTASTRENSHGTDKGLSKSRVNSYQNLINILRNYQKHLGRVINVKDVDIRFGKEFLEWMKVEEKYSVSYSDKKLSDIKSVCRDAQIYGIEVNSQLPKVKPPKPTQEQIIYLNPAEIELISKADLNTGNAKKTKSLLNAREWLLLGVLIGQRGCDLIEISEKSIINSNALRLLNVYQKKGNKYVLIPLYEELEKRLEKGFPEKMSVQRLNKQIKKVCQMAGINSIVSGKVYDKKTKRRKKGSYEKWQLIGTHCFRRSFATNLYGKIPTVLIMQMTGHTTEKMLLKYIGQTPLDYAQQIADAMNSLNK